MPYTDQQLQLLAIEPESHWLERKESFSDKSKICSTVCAFANDITNTGKPGIVWLGIKDDGTVAGITVTDDLLQKVDAIRAEGRIQPLPSLSIQVLSIEGKSVIAIVVEPSSLPPVRYDGRMWVRLSASTQQGNSEDERVLNNSYKNGTHIH